MTDAKDVKVLNDIEHALTRPGMYIGSINVEKQLFWLPEKDKMVYKEVDYIPGLFKIFNELLDNAVDEGVRGHCNEIWVEVDTEKNTYSIRDNGRGIAPDKHSSGKFLPELLFSTLRSGSNFDDSKRETIGMNGVGAALSNIFSSRFVVEIYRDDKLYLQTFKSNCKQIDEPIIKKVKTDSGNRGTKVSFTPDEKIFKKKLNLALIYKRCLELSYAFPDFTFHLNMDGKKKTFEGKKLEDFVKMFGGLYEIIDEKKDGFRMAIMNSEYDQFTHFSNVNGADTWRGGTHIEAIKDIFVDKFKEILKKQYKIEATTNDVAKHLHVVVFQKINAPYFDGQTKEKLATDRDILQKIYDDMLSPRKITSIAKKLEEIAVKIAEAVNEKNQAKELAELRKAQRGMKEKRVAKLIDCNSRDRSKCILYITEGDSAVGGIAAVRDPKTQAGLPLRGKVLNIHGMAPKDIIENKEIQTLMSAIGLEFGKQAVTISRGKVELNGIRYGNISILTDADHDGSAIRCLLINFLFRFWPELFENKIVTISEAPIYRVSDKGRKNNMFFYDRKDFEQFAKGKNLKNAEVSYFKGLGSCDKLAWDFFLNKKPKMYPVEVDDQAKEKLKMAFGDDTDARKKWLK
jgi:DNA topoisomerase II